MHARQIWKIRAMQSVLGSRVISSTAHHPPTSLGGPPRLQVRVIKSTWIKQLKSIMDVLWKTIQNCWDTWNQTWLSHSSSEVFSNIEMQMREREPAAKRLVLGNLVIWTRSLQFPPGDLYKNESQTSFLCFTASFPSFTAPICTDHSLGEWGSKSTIELMVFRTRPLHCWWGARQEKNN